MVFGLAKDCARKGKGYGVSMLISLGMVFGFAVLLDVLAIWLFSGSERVSFLGAIAGVVVLLVGKVFALAGVLGCFFSAFLGAHFGVSQYNECDKFK